MTAWQPEDIALVFVTCPREPSYFAATLASAWLGDERTARLREVVVAVDAPDLACVAPLAEHRRVRWVARSEEENARVRVFKVHRRACHNYWRALGLAQPGARAVLVCEDDLVFRDGWLGMLIECLDEMQERGMTEFLLAAYSAQDHEGRAFRRGRCYSSYVAGGFFGTQAMLYPASELAPLRELIWRHGVEKFEAPYDLLIQRRAKTRQHLYATRHSLVQHAGAQSTGLGTGRHRSPSFERPWPPPDEPVPARTRRRTGKLRVLTSISYDAKLLPHFVAHYRALGVEAFAIAVHEQRPGLRGEIEELARPLGAGIELLPVSERQQRTGVEGWNKEELRQRIAMPGDWLIPADLDEFIQFPAPLPQLIAQMEESGTTHVMGEFRDRIASDGRLTETTAEPALWEQYPLECDFSARLVRCLCTKVVLCRGDCALGSGHHFVTNGARALRGPGVVVHHFKWRAGLLEALARRVEIYRRERVSWVGESERVLAYFARHGRIVPEEFGARMGWQPQQARA